MAKKIIAALAQPFLLEGHEVRTSCSIGIALYPADAGDDETLLKCADTAMYAAKQKGRNTFRFHSQAES
ncbi:MAG: GGDEF domain-containing protein [Sulfuricella denitrificans]|nr:GGDEF domain-containing protein [Sulfuricella denitrificans]